MPKRPTPDLGTTAFSINRQFTGPPFSVMLESAELRRHLLQELAHPLGAKEAKVGPTRKDAKPRAGTGGGKAAGKRRPKKSGR